MKKRAYQIADFVFPLPIETIDLDGLRGEQMLNDFAGRLICFNLHGLPIGHVYVPQSGVGANQTLADVGASMRQDDIVRHIEQTLVAPAIETDVSVLICTRDRAEDLRKCLASLKHQSLRPREIVVVDNASVTGDTREVTLQAGATYVREDRPGLDFARNTAVRASSGKIVAFTDDDVMLHPLWLENLVKSFDEPHIACVTGLLLPGELETPAQFVFETRWGFGRGYRRLDFGPAFYARHRMKICPVWDIGAGASQAFRRDVFEKIGLFDTRLDVGASGCSGDSEFWYRMLHHGFTCRYEPTAVAWHFHRREMQGLQRQIKAYMSGHMSAQIVQWQRTGDLRNLLIFPELVFHFMKKMYKYWMRGVSADNMFVFSEMSGSVAGLVYIFRNPRIPEEQL